MKDDIHMRFSVNALVSSLFAIVGKIFPLFLFAPCESAVDESGKQQRGRIFLIWWSFSTNFPHTSVDGNA
jgi:hypothetical protein